MDGATLVGEYVFDADAWKRPGPGWDEAVLLDLLAALSTGECGLESAPRLVARLIPEAHVRMVEVLEVIPEGVFHRNPGSGADADFLTWVIGCLWNEGSRRELRDGHAVLRVRDAKGCTADVCLPVFYGDELQVVIACSIAADDGSRVLDLAARLTFVIHLMSSGAGQRQDGGPPDQGGHAPGGLSARQMMILEGMAEGLTNRQIAARIAYSESTVRLESMAIYRHFGVHSRHEAVAAARNAGGIRAS